MCVCVCARARMYASICACMHACMHACMYVCMFVCMYVCVCVYLGVCACVCVRARAREGKGGCVRAHVCVFMYLQINILWKCLRKPTPTSVYEGERAYIACITIIHKLRTRTCTHKCMNIIFNI